MENRYVLALFTCLLLSCGNSYCMDDGEDNGSWYYDEDYNSGNNRNNNNDNIVINNENIENEDEFNAALQASFDHYYYTHHAEPDRVNLEDRISGIKPSGLVHYENFYNQIKEYFFGPKENPKDKLEKMFGSKTLVKDENGKLIPADDYMCEETLLEENKKNSENEPYVWIDEKGCYWLIKPTTGQKKFLFSPQQAEDKSFISKHKKTIIVSAGLGVAGTVIYYNRYKIGNAVGSIVKHSGCSIQ